MRRPDHLQGALELLILKSLEHKANHGFGITLHVQTVSGGLLRMEEGSLYPALQDWRAQQNVFQDITSMRPASQCLLAGETPFRITCYSGVTGPLP